MKKGFERKMLNKVVMYDYDPSSYSDTLDSHLEHMIKCDKERGPSLLSRIGTSIGDVLTKSELGNYLVIIGTAALLAFSLSSIDNDDDNDETDDDNGIYRDNDVNEINEYDAPFDEVDAHFIDQDLINITEKNITENGPSPIPYQEPTGGAEINNSKPNDTIPYQEPTPETTKNNSKQDVVWSEVKTGYMANVLTEFAAEKNMSLRFMIEMYNKSCNLSQDDRDELWSKVNNPNYVKYWDMPTEEPTSNATKNFTEAFRMIIPRWNYDTDIEFKEWMYNSSNMDTIENGSLKEVLETIERYTTETSEYAKEGEDEFICINYYSKYCAAFDEAKKMNPELENIYTFNAGATGWDNKGNTIGHSYVGLLSVGEDELYVSFVDPTWSDKEEFNQTTFDALDNEHYQLLERFVIPKEEWNEEMKVL